MYNNIKEMLEANVIESERHQHHYKNIQNNEKKTSYFKLTLDNFFWIRTQLRTLLTSETFYTKYVSDI